MNRELKIRNAIYGAIIADALGVPAEFKSRDELKAHPITEMSGFGTHRQPPGTWSDDSSLILTSMYSLYRSGLDFHAMADCFARWLYDAEFTANEEVFDVGNTCAASIDHHQQTGTFRECPIDENGNGALMRMLPVSIYLMNENLEKVIAGSRQASSITHSHQISQLSCAYYSVIIKNIFGNPDSSLRDIYLMTNETMRYEMSEFSCFERLLAGRLGDFEERQIHSSGYVLHTLEASIWCCLNHKSYKNAVLHAVNLGGDTDTTACVTGGIAALLYGGIPEEFKKRLIALDKINTILNEFIDSIK